MDGWGRFGVRGWEPAIRKSRTHALCRWITATTIFGQWPHWVLWKVAFWCCPTYGSCSIVVGNAPARRGIHGGSHIDGSRRAYGTTKLVTHSVKQRQSLQSHIWNGHCCAIPWARYQASQAGWGVEEVRLGTYLADQQATIGGFLPTIPFMHLSVDLGLMVEWIAAQLPLSAGENGCLAVLHNRNDMVSAFNGSEWVANSEGRIISRGVTSCAGMTAHHVLLAQNKIGFLIGGRSNRFLQLDESEKDAQREEAFARATVALTRATVALTRAQRFCFVMCPLDMKGLIGAATVVGRLQHGAGICEQMVNDDPLHVAQTCVFALRLEEVWKSFT